MAKLLPGIYAAIFALYSFSTHAAELGKLTITSALGQPLRAEIDLVGVQAKELGSISAQLASQEAYQEAKIERSGALQNVRFSVDQKKKGKPVIRVSTARPVNEPFLDMLVELNWPAGHLRREYTILLDPPGFGEPQAVQPIAPPSGTTGSNETASPDQATLAEVKPEPTPLPKSEPEAGPTNPAPNGGQATPPAPGDYAVKKGDTLSSIATRLKPQGVSLEQMLVALYQANNHAFVGKNMNRIRSGQILRIPDEQQIAGTGRAEAAQIIKTHTADWNAYRQKLASAVVEAPAPKEDSPRQSAQGKITTAVEEKEAPAPSPSQDVLKLSKNMATADAKETQQALKAKITGLQEEATAKAKSIREADERIATLEKNVKDMEHLIELKNKNLAEHQGSEGESGKPEEKPASPPAPVVGTAPTAPTAAPPEKLLVAAPDAAATAKAHASSSKTLYFAGGLVGLLLLGGGTVLVFNRQRKKSIYTDQSLTSLYNTTN